MKRFLVPVLLCLPCLAFALPPSTPTAASIGAVPLSAIGAPNGVAPTGPDGGMVRPEDQRPPLPSDDQSAGYFPGDGTYFSGDNWLDPSGQVWQLLGTTNSYQQSDWMLQPSPLACDPQSTSVGCNGAWGTVNARTAYTGNVGTIWRASDQTSLVVPFITLPNGYGVMNSKLADAFCAGAPSNGQRCWFSVLNDHTANGYNLTPAYDGAISAGTPTAQSGTFTKNSVITLAYPTGCAALGTNPQATQISVDTVSAGAISTFHINQYGRCTGTLPSGAQSVASTAVSGGGTSATFPVTYGYPEAAEYFPGIKSNGLPVVSCQALGSSNGPALLNQIHSCNMVGPTGFAWNPSSATWAFGGFTTKGINAPAQIVQTNDATGYGIILNSSSYGVPGLFGGAFGTGKRCTGISIPSTPSVFIVGTLSSAGYCFINNQTAKMGPNTVPTSESATGFQLGGGNLSDFSFTTLVELNSATTADMNALRVDLTASSRTAPQVRATLIAGGASQTYGAGDGAPRNYVVAQNTPWRRTVVVYDNGISSNPLCGATGEDASFNGLQGDAQFYNPFAPVNIYQQLGQMNDPGTYPAGCDNTAGCTAGTTYTEHGCLAHWFYQAWNLSQGFYLVNASLSNPTGTNASYANGDQVVLTPPTGITCSVAPTVTISGVGSLGAGIPGPLSFAGVAPNGTGNVPQKAALGYCTGTGSGVWTQASTTGTGTGATWTVTTQNRSPVAFLGGVTPPQCSKWSGNQQNLLNVTYGYYLDWIANFKTGKLQPAGLCTTPFACQSQAGATGGLLPAPNLKFYFSDFYADPRIGFGGAFPGPAVTQSASALYPAGIYPSAAPTANPPVPFCSTTYSGVGDHPTYLGEDLMSLNIEAGVNALSPFP